jgi:hypothetical protein
MRVSVASLTLKASNRNTRIYSTTNFVPSDKSSTIISGSISKIHRNKNSKPYKSDGPLLVFLGFAVCFSVLLVAHPPCLFALFLRRPRPSGLKPPYRAKLSMHPAVPPSATTARRGGRPLLMPRHHGILGVALTAAEPRGGFSSSPHTIPSTDLRPRPSTA